MSCLGNINYFFFAAHLIDVAVCFKTLGTILQSVTHNGKQVCIKHLEPCVCFTCNFFSLEDFLTLLLMNCSPSPDGNKYLALQLVLTVLLTSIVVYMYTVIAFNFFRKFYNKGEEGEDDWKCHDMLTVRHSHSDFLTVCYIVTLPTCVHKRGYFLVLRVPSVRWCKSWRRYRRRNRFSYWRSV